jgi:hypothetical protein
MAMKFDGTQLTDGNAVVANVSGNKGPKVTFGRGRNSTIIYDGADNLKALLNIRRFIIYEGIGTLTPVAIVRDDKVYKGLSHDVVLGTMKDVEKAIEGPADGIVKAALWVAKGQ